MAIEKLQVGKQCNLAGYPIELFCENNDYFLECKDTVISIEKYLIWKEDPKLNIIGIGKKTKKNCKIININGLIKISCLSTTISNLKILEKNILKQVKWHKQQKQEKKQQQYRS